MSVPVNQQIGSLDIGNKCFGGPFVPIIHFLAQMRENDDIIGTFLAGLVYGCLHILVHGLAYGIPIKAVSLFFVSVMECGHRNLDQRLRCGYAHISNFLLAVFDDLIRREHQISGLEVSEVGGDIAAVKHLGELGELLHSVVELVVAGNSHIIAGHVQDSDDILALRECSDYIPLDSVARINQSDIGILLQKLLFIGGKLGVSDIIVHTAVNIVCVEDDNVLILDFSSAGDK